ncbi:ribosomal-protein-alanine N-acetyltransferase [Bradyrhizobium sp. USDA 4524]|uniref:GNAT family N-acetyltransferase n=1 Tax=unclassified Bradyrhizobium TaxID=2631580 RepID=UPI00209E805E|nr:MULTISPECIES: GNAT family protein [unclassified Bradyrhizobium]MCP1846131.1 ribosomal-protein-alanine N-acetyltransferase [Bradyrhizobium sp. USDA 4538]MCP1907234.1 ribosomal-protein-alanine N-acetyltransferase [Bradyrhizobium sp. USDA 4537]MCP1985710.1 ribosomal-protein-alanine N-acetyltransferase [Bradyrhizobium sp. USDA 4539]
MDERMTPNNTVTLETDELILRSLSIDDTEDLFPILSDRSLLRYLFSASETIEEARKLVKTISGYDRKWATWFVARLKKSGAVCGSFMYFSADIVNKHGSIAYVLLPEFGRRGLANQAVQALIRHMFLDLGFNRIEAEVEKENVRSKAVVAKLGFTREADCLRQRVFLAGEYRDVEMHSLIREDWDRYGN